MRRHTCTWRVCLRFVVSVVTAILYLGSTAWAVEGKGEYHVINAKPPSVSIVNQQSLKVIGSIPLDPHPNHALLGPENRYLYVLHNGRFDLTEKPPKAPSELSILDTNTRTLVRKVHLGWNAPKMSFSKDDLYLFCFTQGRAGKKKQEKEPASITIIVALTNKVEATLSAGRLGKQILF